MRKKISLIFKSWNFPSLCIKIVFEIYSKLAIFEKNTLLQKYGN